ncbi:hypothetical protein H0H93_012787, partial [Arthromyces matolae]
MENEVYPVVNCKLNEWKNPATIEKFLTTTLKAYDVLVDVEATIDLTVADNDTKLRNLRNVVFEALNISTETLCTAFESREEAHIAEKN